MSLRLGKSWLCQSLFALTESYIITERLLAGWSEDQPERAIGEEHLTENYGRFYNFGAAAAACRRISEPLA
jgi:hypothetical protein